MARSAFLALCGKGLCDELCEKGYAMSFARRAHAIAGMIPQGPSRDAGAGRCGVSYGWRCITPRWTNGGLGVYECAGCWLGWSARQWLGFRLTAPQGPGPGWSPVGPLPAGAGPAIRCAAGAPGLGLMGQQHTKNCSAPICPRSHTSSII